MFTMILWFTIPVHWHEGTTGSVVKKVFSSLGETVGLSRLEVTEPRAQLFNQRSKLQKRCEAFSKEFPGLGIHKHMAACKCLNSFEGLLSS